MPSEVFDLDDSDYRSGRGNTRRERKLFLIVCAGKTEATYFNNFRERNVGFEIDIRKCQVSDPKNIVKYALNRIQDLGLDTGNDDFAYCVFDIDQNTSQNLQEAKKLAQENGIKLIQSNPCFEIWYLLHFKYFRNSFSSPAEVIAQIEEFIQNYQKTKDYSSMLSGKQTTAVSNARKLAKENGEGNPSTQVHELVEKLLEILGK